jgi:hypothetical protein
MYNFSIFFRPILNQIAANPITTNGDRIPLNIAIPKTGGHHQQKAKIAGLCYVHVTPMINGDIRFSFTSSADSKRANKAEGADAIEIAGRIDTPADPATKLKYKPLASADDGTEKTIHTKSGFILKLGSGNTGNYFQFYCRWTNTKNPDIAGSWTGPLVVVIP